MRTSLIVIALSVSTAAAIRAVDQADTQGPDATRPGLSPSCAVSQCLFDKAPMLNAPFSAAVSITWNPPAARGLPMLRATALYCRDSAGRVRVEQTFAGNARERRIFVVPDATARIAYALNPATRTVSTPVALGLAEMMVGSGGHEQFVLPLAIDRFIGVIPTPLGRNSSSLEEWEPLEAREIEGVPATGVRFMTRLPRGVNHAGRAERWVSPELNLVVYATSEDRTLGLFEYRLTGITRREPSPELFEVPADYDVVALKFPIRWESPYSRRVERDVTVARRP